MIFLSGGPEDFCKQDDDSHPDLVSANKWVDTGYIKDTTDDLGGGSDIQEHESLNSAALWSYSETLGRSLFCSSDLMTGGCTTVSTFILVNS